MEHNFVSLENFTDFVYYDTGIFRIVVNLIRLFILNI